MLFCLAFDGFLYLEPPHVHSRHSVAKSSYCALHPHCPHSFWHILSLPCASFACTVASRRCASDFSVGSERYIAQKTSRLSHTLSPTMERKPVSETHPHLKDFFKLLEVAREESDRGSVLIHASMLDDMLAQIVNAYLISDPETEALTDGFNAPIGTFSARILMAFSLGTISKEEYRELNLIRKVRNDFAHSIEASFADARIAARCYELTFAAMPYGEVKVNARGRFITAASALILTLVNRAHYVRQERLAYKPWRI
jgi:mannitol operon repressor